MFFRRFRRGCSVLFPGDQCLLASTCCFELSPWSELKLELIIFCSYRDEYVLAHSENFTGEKMTRANKEVGA